MPVCNEAPAFLDGTPAQPLVRVDAAASETLLATVPVLARTHAARSRVARVRDADASLNDPARRFAPAFQQPQNGRGGHWLRIDGAGQRRVDWAGPNLHTRSDSYVYKPR